MALVAAAAAAAAGQLLEGGERYEQHQAHPHAAKSPRQPAESDAAAVHHAMNTLHARCTAFGCPFHYLYLTSLAFL